MAARETFFEHELIPDLMRLVEQQNVLLSELSLQIRLLAEALRSGGASGVATGGIGASTNGSVGSRGAGSRSAANGAAHGTQGSHGAHAAMMLPIPPPRLIEQLQAAGNIKWGRVYIVSFPVFVPAGQRAIVEMHPEAGVSIVILGAIQATCDVYSAGLQVLKFYVNGTNVIQPGLPYVIDSPKQFVGGQYVIVGDYGIALEVYNPSAFDATLVIAAEAAHVDNDVVNTFIVPTLDFAYHEMRSILGSVGE